MSKLFCVTAVLATFALSAFSADHDTQVDKMKEAIATLKAPALTAYKITSEDKSFEFDKDNEKQIYGWTILQTNKIDDKTILARTIEILTDKKSYTGPGAKCFEPGFAFRFKQDDKQYAFVICLQCNWVYATDGKEQYQWPLGAEGKAALKKLYADIFFVEREAKK